MLERFPKKLFVHLEAILEKWAEQRPQQSEQPHPSHQKAAACQKKDPSLNQMYKPACCVFFPTTPLTPQSSQCETHSEESQEVFLAKIGKCVFTDDRAENTCITKPRSSEGTQTSVSGRLSPWSWIGPRSMTLPPWKTVMPTT